MTAAHSFRKCAKSASATASRDLPIDGTQPHNRLGQLVTFVDMASANRARAAVAGERSKQAVPLESMLGLLKRKPPPL